MISPSTICYALNVTYDFLRSKYLLERTEYNRKCLEELSDAVDEIDDGKFEIEGYERVQWTKFDPKDKSTFPDNLTPVLICYKNGKVREEFHWAKGEFGVNIDPTTITHWHPLPKPPIETEAEK